MKERLTGAIILVALLVLLVPELLTGPSSKSVAEPAGAETGALRSYTIDLADDPARRPANTAGPTPAPETTVTDEPVAQASGESGGDADAGLSAQDAEVAQGSTGATADTEREPLASSAGTGEPELAPAPTDLGVAHGSSADPAAARPAPSAATERPRAEAPRAEPVRPRPEPAPVGRAESPKPAVVETPRAASSKGWSVQLGAFGNRDNAERLVKQVKGKGFAAAINENPGSKLRYRVRVGSERDRAGADALAAKLRSAGHKDATVVPPG